MSMNRTLRVVVLLLLLGTVSAVAVSQSQRPPGDDKTAKTRTLELGAKALQGNAPLGPIESRDSIWSRKRTAGTRISSISRTCSKLGARRRVEAWICRCICTPAKATGPTTRMCMMRFC